MFFEVKKKNVNEFARLICKLNGAQIIGLTRLLQVKVFYDDVKDDNGKPMPRGGEAIIEDCLVKFNALNYEKRREILKLLRLTVKEKKN